MRGTAKWYCARCSRFMDDAQTRCGTCGRARGSARAQQGDLEAPTRSWTCFVVSRGKDDGSSAGHD